MDMYKAQVSLLCLLLRTAQYSDLATLSQLCPMRSKYGYEYYWWYRSLCAAVLQLHTANHGICHCDLWITLSHTYLTLNLLKHTGSKMLNRWIKCIEISKKNQAGWRTGKFHRRRCWSFTRRRLGDCWGSAIHLASQGSSTSYSQTFCAVQRLCTVRTFCTLSPVCIYCVLLSFFPLIIVWWFASSSNITVYYSSVCMVTRVCLCCNWYMHLSCKYLGKESYIG